MTASLTAFALVADEYVKSGDPVRGLIPLFRPILRERSGREFEPKWFAERFTEMYGMAMSPYVAKSIAENLVSAGVLQSSLESRAPHSIVPSNDLDVDSHRINEDEIRQIVGYFEKWATQEIKRLNISLRTFDPNAILLGRLAHPEFASVFLEKGRLRDSARIKRLLGKVEFEEESRFDQLFDFLVARFLLTAHETAPEIFDQLASIAFGALIADAVAGIAVSGIRAMPDPPLRVVVDGPLLLDALDIHTSDHFVYAKSLFEMMSKAGFRVVTFDHVVDEARESIKSTLRAYSAGVAYGPFGDRLRSTPGLFVQANILSDTLEEKINDLGISVVRSELYERADFKKYFDDEAFDRIRNAIGDVHHQLERRIRDAKSVATVIRLKKDNRKPSSVFEAGTIFLTRNSALAKQVNRTLAAGRTDPDPRFTVLTDSQLAGTLWFSLGSATDFAAFSKQRLIANCSSAIVPQREVIQRISEMLEGVDESLKLEFETLMRDKRASLCAMRITSGFPGAVDQALSQKVLDEMRNELAAPIVDKAMAELSAERRELIQLQHEMRGSQETNMALQTAISDSHEKFSYELAQLSIQLDGELLARTRLNQEISNQILECETRLDAQRRRLESRRRLVRRILIGLWMAACASALFLSIFPELMDKFWQKLSIFLVLLTTIGAFGALIDQPINYMVRIASVGIVRKIVELEEQKNRLELLLLQSNAG